MATGSQHSVVLSAGALEMNYIKFFGRQALKKGTKGHGKFTSLFLPSVSKSLFSRRKPALWRHKVEGELFHYVEVRVKMEPL